MKKWLKRFLIGLAVLAGILAVLAGIVFLRIKTLSKEESEQLIEYVSTPGNNIVNFAIKFKEMKITFYRLTGNYEKELAACEHLVSYYEYLRYFYQRQGTDEEVISQWFTNIVPFYKEVALLELQGKIRDELEERKGMYHYLYDWDALYYSELCRSRTLTDHYNDVLISKSYAMLPDEKEKLQNYRIELEKLARSGAEEEYLKLKKKEREYKRDLRGKYSTLLISSYLAEKTEYGFTLNNNDELKGSFGVLHKGFGVSTGSESMPDNSCFIEFLKISDDSMIVFVTGDYFANIVRYESFDTEEVKPLIIPTDKKFYENVLLYHDLTAYSDINALHRDGKYLWSLPNDKYVITVGRNAPNSSAKAVNDNAKWLELRQTLSIEISQKVIQPVENLIAEYKDSWDNRCRELGVIQLEDPNKHWIISPDAELNLIPFETLIYHDKMLIESVDVSYVPSLARFAYDET